MPTSGVIVAVGSKRILIIALGQNTKLALMAGLGRTLSTAGLMEGTSRPGRSRLTQ